MRRAGSLVGAGVMALGGGTLAAGAFLPWLTLYGGLHLLAGTIGPVGKGLVAVGIVLIALAGAMFWRPASRLGPLVACLGGVALVCVIDRWWAAVTFVADPAHVMLVPAVGAGPRVAAAGAVVALVGAVLTRRATTFGE